MHNNKKIAIMFPGQGSQYVGMGLEFLDQDQEAGELMDLAESACGFPLRKLCLEGPIEELTRVGHLQPYCRVLHRVWNNYSLPTPSKKPF